MLREYFNIKEVTGNEWWFIVIRWCGFTCSNDNGALIMSSIQGLSAVFLLLIVLCTLLAKRIDDEDWFNSLICGFFVASGGLCLLHLYWLYY